MSITGVSTSTVAVTRAAGYDPAGLKPSVQGALRLIGGLQGFVSRGDRVFVKINHLSPASPPERGIVTHPHFTEAVLTALMNITPHITVGDDIDGNGDDGFVLSGYREMCRRLGVRLVNLRETGFAPVKCEGSYLKEVYVAREALEADAIINLPKLKTHSLCLLTGAVKNMYGVMPAGMRRRYHGDFLDPAVFSRAIVDIFASVQPRLNIMDAVMAMEGEGPGSGHTRLVGLVLASPDAVALDAVASQIVGLAPEQVITTRDAGERGLGNSQPGRIRVVGEDISSVAARDFKMPASAAAIAAKHAPGWLGRLLISQMTPRPHVVQENCTACGACVRVCPTGAITIPEDKAVISERPCIRCMCCHEVCRYEAIAPRPGAIGQAASVALAVVRKLLRK